ncbi:unnamed protein product [Caenorhabditis angaria]|uniref:Uncharacterized protein n=1 Tax=Caenorhabditis angaria TaxID=860376 RepID=A0A9P1N412_9PELO|nr:unnamed protein product [Caenorhabditis angaria]
MNHHHIIISCNYPPKISTSRRTFEMFESKLDDVGVILHDFGVLLEFLVCSTSIPSVSLPTIAPSSFQSSK